MSDLDPAPTGLAARRAALRLLDAVLRQGLPLEAALDSAARDLDRADDRALAHAMAAGVLRRLPDLDRLIDGATDRPIPPDAKARMVLRLALVQALAMGIAEHAAIATVLPLVDGGPRRLVHGVFSTVLRAGAALADPPALPGAVARRWKRAWGKEMVEAAQHAIAAPPPIDITLRDPVATGSWADRLGGVSLAPGHVRLPAGTRIGLLDGYEEGAWWVQDIAASLPARLLGAGGGRRVLDLCAAPGGKAMQLAAAGWRVTAVDRSERRMARLVENLARTGLAAEIIVADALDVIAPELFDAVLLDAPCSATGIFRRHPDVLHRVRAPAIEALAEAQRALLDHAARLVRPGGHLVYAVCSLEPAEGEEVAARFAGPDFAVSPIDPAALPPGIPADPAGHLRVLPGVLAQAGGAEGFFVAAFTRRG